MSYYRLLLISLALYVWSLFVPCLSGSQGWPFFDYPGWMALALGYTVFHDFQFAWIANPLYFISFILSFIRISRVTLTLSILASIFTLNTFTWKYDIYFGAYLWMASIFTLTALQILYIKKLVK